MRHTKTISWHTPDTVPPEVVAMYLIPDDGSNVLFATAEIEDYAESFIPDHGIVLGLVEQPTKGFWASIQPTAKVNGKNVVGKYIWDADEARWDDAEFLHQKKEQYA